MSIERPEAIYSQVAEALRADMRAGVYPPGAQLPSERELRDRFGVSGTTVKAAIVQLRAEKLVTSRRGIGVFVAEHPPLSRLDTDISAARGFYTALDRAGKRPATITTVDRGPATPDAADALGIPEGSEVVIRHRLMRAEGDPPICLATSYFPLWVVEAAPKLADPDAHGQPQWLRDAFGPFYSEDYPDARAATKDEAEALEISVNSPVLTIKGTTLDQEHRTLAFIYVVAAPGRFNPQYRYGAVPEA